MFDTLKYYGLAVVAAFLLDKYVALINTYVTVAVRAVLLLYLVKLLSVIFRSLLPRRYVRGYNKAVLITGCDTGFGHELAKRLYSEGFLVFAGCLNVASEGAKVLNNLDTSRIEVLQLDVTKPEEIRAAVKSVNEKLTIQEFWAVVNNAGILQYSEMEWHNEEMYRKMFEINTFGTVRVSQAFLPFLRRSKGRIVNVTSLVARQCLPRMTAYSMSKAAALSFCEGLRVELMKWGIKVCSIEPWLFKTPLTTVDGSSKLIAQVWEKTPDEVKAAYGSQYLDAFCKSITEFLETGITNTGLVLDAMVDAVMAKEPLVYYTVAPLYCKIPFWISQQLPRSVLDFLLTLAQPRAVPAELEGRSKRYRINSS